MRSQILLGLATLSLLLTGNSPAWAATIVVDTLLDEELDDGVCSLREAILAANLDQSGGGCLAGSGTSDRIHFSVSGTIQLVAALPFVTHGVAIEGPGRDLLAIDGDDQFRTLAFVPASPMQYVVRDLSLLRGRTPAGVQHGGCIWATNVFATLAVVDVTVANCVAATNGGGIASAGTLLLERVWLDANEAQGPSGGGGVHASGIANVEISDSSFTGNRTSGTNGSGGALHLSTSGAALITNSTFSGNLANSFGGALHLSGILSNVLSVTLRDSTLLGNESDVDETSSTATGGTIHLANQTTSQVTLTLANTVVAGGRDNASSACHEILIALGAPPAELVSAGFNLIADGSCVESVFPESPGAGLPNAQGDFVGTSAFPIDPRLDVLAANGGPTPTHLPLSQTPHPVVDQGSCPGSLHDQRGLRGAASSHRPHDVAAVPNNPDGDSCDIGAVERGASLPTHEIFTDGFELGTTLLWSAELP